ncbi:MAG: hypothetical protein K6T68_15300, partial [Alicyclobacillus shizuokensis]|nr:hypothetical protein [Alicyclobacillus shizuokensis]
MLVIKIGGAHGLNLAAICADVAALVSQAFQPALGFRLGQHLPFREDFPGAFDDASAFQGLEHLGRGLE